MGLPAVTEETAALLRHLGVILALFAVIMIAFSLGSMLWMDIPLLAGGAAFTAYGIWGPRRVETASPDAP